MTVKCITLAEFIVRQKTHIAGGTIEFNALFIVRYLTHDKRLKSAPCLYFEV